MDSSSEKLPRGQSFFLKPAAIEAAFAEAGIDIRIGLRRYTGAWMDAIFYPGNRRNGTTEWLSIRAGSVASQEAPAVRRWIDEEALPYIVNWVANILAQDEKSPLRREQQVLSFRIPLSSDGV